MKQKTRIIFLDLTDACYIRIESRSRLKGHSDEFTRQRSQSSQLGRLARQIIFVRWSELEGRQKSVLESSRRGF